MLVVHSLLLASLVYGVAKASTSEIKQRRSAKGGPITTATSILPRSTQTKGGRGRDEHSYHLPSSSSSALHAEKSTTTLHANVDHQLTVTKHALQTALERLAEKDVFLKTAASESKELKEQVTSLEQQVTSLRHQLLEATTERARLNEQLAETRTLLASIEEQHLKLHVDNESSEEEMNKLKTSNKVLIFKIESYKTHNAELKDYIDRERAIQISEQPAPATSTPSSVSMAVGQSPPPSLLESMSDFTHLELLPNLEALVEGLKDERKKYFAYNQALTKLVTNYKEKAEEMEARLKTQADEQSSAAAGDNIDAIIKRLKRSQREEYTCASVEQQAGDSEYDPIHNVFYTRIGEISTHGEKDGTTSEGAGFEKEEADLPPQELVFNSD